MLSFDDDTRLTVRKQGVHVDVRIPRGFVIMFNGNLSHSGSEYLNRDNKRLFLKELSVGYSLPNDEELDVAPKRQACIGKKDGCKGRFDSYSQMYYHYRTHCEFAPEEVKEQRSERKSKKSDEYQRAKNKKAKNNNNT